MFEATAKAILDYIILYMYGEKVLYWVYAKFVWRWILCDTVDDDGADDCNDFMKANNCDINKSLVVWLINSISKTFPEDTIEKVRSSRSVQFVRTNPNEWLPGRISAISSKSIIYMTMTMRTSG